MSVIVVSYEKITIHLNRGRANAAFTIYSDQPCFGYRFGVVSSLIF